jgi:hypothetical protein
MEYKAGGNQKYDLSAPGGMRIGYSRATVGGRIYQTRGNGTGSIESSG